MQYRLLTHPVQFPDNWESQFLEFEANSDETAIQYCENPPEPFKFVLPNGETRDVILVQLQSWGKHELSPKLIKNWP